MFPARSIGPAREYYDSCSSRLGSGRDYQCERVQAKAEANQRSEQKRAVLMSDGYWVWGLNLNGECGIPLPHLLFLSLPPSSPGPNVESATVPVLDCTCAQC